MSLSSRRSLMFAAGALLLPLNTRPASATHARWFPSRRRPPGLQQRRLNVNGYQIAVYEGGAGPAVMLLHGIPDSAAGWREQIEPLVSAGYRIIAPDLLGAGESEIAPGVAPYTRPKQVAMTLAVIDSLGVATLHALIGHDRGAGTAWAFAAAHPTRLERLVVLSVGHPDSLHAAMDIRQRERFWYTLRFQFPDAADALRANDWQLFREWMGNHAEVNAWIEDLSRPGALEAVLNYYRANFDPMAKGRPVGSVATPTTAVWSTDDLYLGESQMLNSTKFVTGTWRYERVEGAGHFMQLDKPCEVNELLLDSLRKA